MYINGNIHSVANSVTRVSSDITSSRHINMNTLVFHHLSKYSKVYV